MAVSLLCHLYYHIGQSSEKIHKARNRIVPVFDLYGIIPE
jgi:hypothetical protein